MTTRQLAKIAKRVGYWALIALIMVYAVFPFYYAVITSIKPSSDLFRVELWPSDWNMNNYVQIFSQTSFLRAIFNSIIIAFSVVFISLIPASELNCAICATIWVLSTGANGSWFLSCAVISFRKSDWSIVPWACFDFAS
mgnify:CR=1 FL=1